MNIDEILEKFEKNKNSPLSSWTTFDSLFKPGKQGIVGKFNIKENFSEDTQIIFKISQYINFLPYHEMTVLDGLQKISYCPNFMKGVGVVKELVEPKMIKRANPFEITSKYPIIKEILLLEYIDGDKLYEYIKDEAVNEKIIFNIIKQVLCAIIIGQKVRFTHYDLHSYNILLKKCDPNLFVLYIINNKKYLIPTYGYQPVIIDFGFSYIENMDKNYCWPSLAHTDVGFMSDRFDRWSDPKLFLITVSNELYEYKKSNRTRALKKYVRKIFRPLSIDMDSGWDNFDEYSAIDHMLNHIKDVDIESKLFKECDVYAFDILQSLIVLPLKKRCYKDIKSVYKIFVDEWNKIEDEINNQFFNLYVLKDLVNAARYVDKLYKDTSTRVDAVNEFKRLVVASVDRISKYCRLKDINYEKILCSLFLLVRCIEGFCFDVIDNQMDVKNDEYEKMEVENIDEIIEKICAISDYDIEIDNDSIIIVVDSDKEIICSFNVNIDDEEFENFNNFKKQKIIENLYKNI